MIVGHRGGRGEGWPPENTLAAFERALEDERADGVELDVRRCWTGEVVVFHDPKLADGRPVESVAFRDLPKLGGESIPLLADVLELCRGTIVNVEVKADTPGRYALVDAVARALRIAPPDTEIVVSSFDPRAVMMLAALAPRIPRAMLVGEGTPGPALALPLTLRRLLVAAHLQDELLDATRVARLRRAGLRVVAWTVNDVSRAEHLEKIGVEWLITDCPGRLRARLRRANGASAE